MYRHGSRYRATNRLARTLAIASVFFAVDAGAQAPSLHIDDDASAVPRGALRVGMTADFGYADQLRQPDGHRVPLGRRLGFDSTRDNVVVVATVATTRLPISLAYGVTRWLSLGVSAPLVRRRVEVAADTNVRRPPAPPVRTRLTDPSALTSFTHANIGDVDVTARVALFDSHADSLAVRLRVAAEGGYRLGVGPSRRSNNMLDPGAGDGHNDVIARVFADATLGRRWSVTVAGSRTWQRPDRDTVVAVDSVFPSRQIRGDVARDLGDLTSLMIAPRYRLTRYIQFAAALSRTSKTADRYEGAPPAEGWGLVAPPIAAYSATSVTAGVVFSTTPTGGAIGPWPIDLVFEHGQIVHSSGASIPDFRFDRLGGRVYMKLF